MKLSRLFPNIRQNLCIAAVIVLAVWSDTLCGIMQQQTYPLNVTLEAIRMVESSGGADLRDGDDGRAVGEYQIHDAYWQDGTRVLKVEWPYRDARDPKKARQVVQAYVTHYQKAGGYPANPETWARLHNGGPRGPQKKSTEAYWAKVQEHLPD